MLSNGLEKCILQYKTVNLGTGGDQIENVLWRIDDIVLPKSIRSVVIHWGTNNIDASSSDEISVSVVTIARLDPFPIVTQILRSLLVAYYQETFIGLREELKLMRPMIIWETIGKIKKTTFMRQDPDWTLPDNSLNMELYYKDHLHLTENGNMKLSKLIIETLKDLLSPQSSQLS